MTTCRHWIASIVTIRSLVPSKIIFRRQMMFWRWGSPVHKSKEKIVAMLKAKGAVFQSIIHPYVALGRFNTIGEGAVIYSGFGMTVNIKIGDFCTLLACGLGHDVEVGDFSTISSWCNIMGHVKIGNRVFMGGNCSAAPNAVIEDDAYVGVGSVVLRKVKAGKRAFGNPAREMEF